MNIKIILQHNYNMSSFTDEYMVAIENNNFESLKSLVQNSSYEPGLIKMIPFLLDKMIQHKEASLEICELILKKMNVYAMPVYKETIYNSFASLKWQIKVGALSVLGKFAKYQSDVVKQHLPDMILNLIQMSSEVKPQVKQQTKICFQELCSVIDNVDILKIIPVTIDAYMEPMKYTDKALDELVATSFINEVDSSTLGLLVPILIRGMREKKVASKRRAALVIGNMCKLVNDPRTAAEFYSILKPVLERGIDEIAIEEVRNVCSKSLETLERVASEASEISDNIIKENELYKLIQSETKNNDDDLIRLSSRCCNGIVLQNNRSYDAWNQCIRPYFSTLENIDDIVKIIYDKATLNMTPDKVDPEDEEEDLCNAQFSLAYGTRVLLHQTPFRVKIGRKYGLVGPNGAGKSTLMKSIAGGNLQGFPTELITVYVECEIIGEKADMSVIEYIMIKK